MKNKYFFVLALLLVITVVGMGFSLGYEKMTAGQQADFDSTSSFETLHIVTSFYPMQIAAMNLAEDCPGVTVESLSEPQTGCLHDYQLTPQDMILLSRADVFVINGGGIEGFLSEVAEEYPDLTIIDAGAGIFSREEALETDHPEEIQGEDQEHDHEHGENAHAWMSISHYRQQVEMICQGLCEKDPGREEQYRKNAQRYLKKMEPLQQEAEELKDQLQDTHVILFHEAYEYVAEDYGMIVDGVLNLDEERQVSAGEVAQIIDVIRQKEISILLAEEQYGRDMGNTIERETDCKVYYLDTLVRGQETADSWLEGMGANMQILREAVLR